MMSKIGIEMVSIENEMDRDATFLPLSPPARSGCPLLPQSFPSTCPLPSHRPLSPRQVPREPDRPARPLIFEARWHLVGISSHCDKYFPTHHHATDPFHDKHSFRTTISNLSPLSHASHRHPAQLTTTLLHNGRPIARDPRRAARVPPGGHPVHQQVAEA